MNKSILATLAAIMLTALSACGGGGGGGGNAATISATAFSATGTDSSGNPRELTITEQSNPRIRVD